MRLLAARVCAVLIVAISFASYASRFSPVGRWQADNYDPADYRMVAEYFWGVPSAPDTYDDLWHGGWGAYLRTVPFRAVGLGTLYLSVGWLRLGHAPSTPGDVLAAGIALAALEKILLAAVLLVLFTAVNRRWGAIAALLTLTFTAFPSSLWRISDDFLTEPVHRIIFLLAFACAVRMTDRRSTVRMAFALSGLMLLATHVKVQWYVGALLLLPIVLYQFWTKRVPARTAVLFCLVTAGIPLSVVAVNWIGWRSTSLSPGIGLHANLKYEGDVLREFTRKEAGDAGRPPFADPERPHIRWWNIYIGADVGKGQYEAFDDFARAYVRARPASAARSLWEGLRLASTLPGIERVEHGLVRLEPLGRPWSAVVRYSDLAVWALLLVGLAFDDTRLPSALGLVLWIVPAVGNVISPYELRYHLPMAGLGASAGVCVLARLLETQGVRRLLGHGTAVQ